MSGPASIPPTPGPCPVRVPVGGIVLEFPSPTAGHLVAWAIHDACESTAADAAVAAWSEPEGIPA